MSKALKNFTNQSTQTEKANNRQVKNNAGGFAFEVSDKSRLERFLILGTDGGTYYASERDITKQNFDFLIDMAARDPRLFIDTVVDVSVNNRAAKNSPAIFALAVAMNSVAPEYKADVREAVAKVCRTSTHLFEFAQYVENLGGWGRAKKSAVASWYTSKSADELGLQAVKYRQRNGWTHRDLLRLSHPALRPEVAPVANFMLGKGTENAPRIVEGFQKVQQAKTAAEAAALVTEYRLPWETVPTQFLNDADLWKAFIESKTVGHTAVLRNVVRMEKIGAFKDLKFAKTVADILSDPEQVRKGRLHPVGFLNAYGAYVQIPGNYFGYGRRRPAYPDSTTPAIVGALEDGFYASFANVEPSNARTMLAIDISGSMTWASPAGLANLDCRQAAGAMATVTLRTEPYTMVTAFTGGYRDGAVTPVNISKNASFVAATEKINKMYAGATDCAAPMLYAADKGVDIDHFVVYTDNETWAGRVHPFQALKDYRQKTGINAKLTVVGMTATNFSIADPQDPGMLDVVGFDAAAPKIMADFARV